MTERFKTLYERPRMPIFQNRVYPTREAARASVTGDMCLVQDTRTGLIFNRAFDPDLLVYDADYQNEQGHSASFQRHLDDVLDVVERLMGTADLVEVGCGKGFFLERALARGLDITGFDSAYEGSNPRIRKELFRPGLGIEARALVLRHVLEHIQDPVSFLQQLARANGGHGLIYIEVPCFDWIMENRTWFDIFYEHVNYFRLEDFDRIFGRVVESGRLFGGQYLYVVADLSEIESPQVGDAELVDLPDDFTSRLDALAARREDDAVVWGGSSKGVIFSLMLERAGSPVSLVVDINPAKQGRFLPLTGLEVVSPERLLELTPAGRTVYVMNSNYLAEIEEMSGRRYTYVAADAS